MILQRNFLNLREYRRNAINTSSFFIVQLSTLSLTGRKCDVIKISFEKTFFIKESLWSHDFRIAPNLRKIENLMSPSWQSSF